MRWFAIEQSAERDALIEALLPLVPAQGWTMAAARAAAPAAGFDPRDVAMLFPRGQAELLEAWCDLADRRMAEAAAAMDFSGRRAPERVRMVIAARLALMRPHKEAVRRALGLLALPMHAAAATRTLARTASAIWYAAGDSAVGFDWYSKRATLAGVYSATLLAWLTDPSDDDRATLGFLDRRLSDVGRIGAARKRIGERLSRLRPRRAAEGGAAAG
jgi:ubiquinone biosynthesis protein COQ9